MAGFTLRAVRFSMPLAITSETFEERTIVLDVLGAFASPTGRLGSGRHDAALTREGCMGASEAKMTCRRVANKVETHWTRVAIDVHVNPRFRH